MERHSDSDDEPVRWSRAPRTTPPVIDRRVLPNGEVEEWERASTIPDDFIYDPETHSYSAPGEGSEWNKEIHEENVRRFLEERLNAPPIPPEQLRVDAGTLKGPASRRKSLGAKGGLLFDLSDHDEHATIEKPADDDDAES